MNKRSILLFGSIGALAGLIILTVVFTTTYDKGDMHTNIAVFHDDIKYCQSSNPRQEMDIHVPKNASKNNPAPFVFYVHGGGWKEGSLRNNIDDYYPKFLIKKGIAFVTVDYRLVPEATYPTQNNDIACAFDYLQKNAAEYNLDAKRVGIMGDSAGGQLASIEAFRSSPGGSVKGLATLYGVADLWFQITEFNSKTAIAYLGKKDETLAKKASPYYAPIKHAVPSLLIHGTKDTIVSFSNSERQYERLENANIPAELLPVEGAGHGFGDAKGSKEQAYIQPTLTRFFVDRLK